MEECQLLKDFGWIITKVILSTNIETKDCDFQRKLDCFERIWFSKPEKLDNPRGKIMPIHFCR